MTDLTPEGLRACGWKDEAEFVRHWFPNRGAIPIGFISALRVYITALVAEAQRAQREASALGRPDPFDVGAVRPAWTRIPSLAERAPWLADELERIRQWRDALRNRLADLPGAQSILEDVEAEFCVVAWECRKERRP